MMRLLLATIALTVYIFTVCTAFACPLMPAAAAHEAPCSDCPKEETCPAEACIFICPYTIEKTALITADEHEMRLVPAVPTALDIPSLTRKVTNETAERFRAKYGREYPGMAPASRTHNCCSNGCC